MPIDALEKMNEVLWFIQFLIGYLILFHGEILILNEGMGDINAPTPLSAGAEKALEGQGNARPARDYTFKCLMQGDGLYRVVSVVQQSQGPGSGKSVGYGLRFF